MSPELGSDARESQTFYIDRSEIGKALELDYVAVREFIRHSEPLVKFVGDGWVAAENEGADKGVFESLVDNVRRLFEHEDLQGVSKLIWANKRFVVKDNYIVQKKHDIVIKEKARGGKSKKKKHKKHLKKKKKHQEANLGNNQSIVQSPESQNNDFAQNNVIQQETQISDEEPPVTISPNQTVIAPENLVSKSSSNSSEKTESESNKTTGDGIDTESKEVAEDGSKLEVNNTESQEKEAENNNLLSNQTNTDVNQKKDKADNQVITSNFNYDTKKNFTDKAITNAENGQEVQLDQNDPNTIQKTLNDKDQEILDNESSLNKRILIASKNVTLQDTSQINEYISMTKNSIDSLIKNTKSETLKKVVEEYLVSFQNPHTYLMIFEQKGILDLKGINVAFEIALKFEGKKAINSLKIHTINSKKFKEENENSKKSTKPNKTDISDLLDSTDLDYSWENDESLLVSKALFDLPKRSIIIFEIGFEEMVELDINVLLIKQNKIFYNMNEIMDLEDQAPEIKVKDSVIKDEQENEQAIEENVKNAQNVSESGESDIKNLKPDLVVETHKSSEMEKMKEAIVGKELKKVSENEFTIYLYLLFFFVFLFSLLLIGKVFIFGNWKWGMF